MKKLILWLLLCILISGCSQGKPGATYNDFEQDKQEQQAAFVTEAREIAALAECPVKFVDTPDSPRIYDLENRTLRQAQLISMMNPIATYVAATGEWPDSWDELKNDYVWIMPIDPNTRIEYQLLNLSDLDETAPANSIVADWGDHGCDLYTARPGKDDWDFTSEGNEYMQQAVDILKSGPGKSGEKGAGFDDPAYRLMICIRTWMEASIGYYWGFNRQLPSSQAELMYGFKLNPDFNPGYTISKDSINGKFTIATLPTENKYFFRCTFDDPKQSIMYPMHLAGEYFGERRPFAISESQLQDFNALMTEADIFN